MKLDDQQLSQTNEVERVEVQTRWFKLKIEEINWKTIIVVALILAAIVEIVKILAN